jgi:Phosphodiester glycosidase
VKLRQAAVALAALAAAGCTAATPAASHPAAQAGRPRTPGAASRSPSARPPRPTPKPKPPVVPASVVVSSFRAADGSLITLAEFRGAVTFRLHAGSADPGYPALSQLRAGPAVVGGERRRLVAAFNGGFKLSQGDGGYEQEGHVISPLVRGLASLVIDRSGAAVIGVWGYGLPQPGEAVDSVRQNLSLLVSHGQATASAADWGLWGATLGGGEFVARSALGQDAAGQLIFAGSMSASPADLAAALVHAGARRAMELDINPEWVQLDVARRPGHSLTAVMPGQQRPADQFLVGWIRDFITVLAPP